MRKYLPLFFLVTGVFIFLLVFIFIKNKKAVKIVENPGASVEVPFVDRPFASLTPTSDGRYINLRIDKITLSKAVSLDYELLYSLPDDRIQGVPGTIDLDGKKSFERKLLLGSESNGKFRYDEGVKEGSLTVRFRDSKGKLLTKFSTKWHLQSNETELSSVDGNFKYKLEKKPRGIYFITMETFGLPDETITSVESGPYGIFASDELPKGLAENWKMASPNLFYK